MQPTGVSSTIDPPCRTYDDAKAKQIHCRHCELQGHLMIFHRNYTGLPTMTITDHNGEQREVRACIACHCCCEVGKWMRACSTEDIKKRTPVLSEVGIGPLKNWSSYDPRLPQPRDDDPPGRLTGKRFAAGSQSILADKP